MTFFEQELRKIVPDKSAVFVGRACYLVLSDTNRAKIQFVSCRTHGHYDALDVTILNRNDGKVDSLRIRFEDVLGVKPVNNRNFPNGISPHAWTYKEKTEWYGYQPNGCDYEALASAIKTYLDVFRVPH